MLHKNIEMEEALFSMFSQRAVALLIGGSGCSVGSPPAMEIREDSQKQQVLSLFAFFAFFTYLLMKNGYKIQ